MPRNPQKNLTPKQKGRPKNSGLKIPHWAHQAIAALSSRSGVSGQKILENALRNGIQLVGEPLGNWVKYQKTSEQQWNEYLENFTKAGPPVGAPAVQEAPPDPLSDSRTLEDTGRVEPGEEGLDIFDEQRGQQSEVFAIDQARNGE